MKMDFSNWGEKSEQSLVLIAVLMLATFWLGMCSANAQQFVATEEIRANLCRKALCLTRWNEATILTCQPQPQFPVAPGTDMVFGSFIQGSRSCWCPCNFPKFYP